MRILACIIYELDRLKLEKTFRKYENKNNLFMVLIQGVLSIIFNYFFDKSSYCMYNNS